MGWVGPMSDKPIVPKRNVSGRFESRFCKIKIIDDSSMWFAGMKGCVLGTWVAHGEGRLQIAPYVYEQHRDMFPVRYVKSTEQTVEYPYNPNGSDFGAAGMISANGLHLAMMPHPERCVKSWQNPWYPEHYQSDINNSSDKVSMPWLVLFKNAYNFAIKQ
jgi:phosphoribosylformylglycinamidine synthase